MRPWNERLSRARGVRDGAAGEVRGRAGEGKQRRGEEASSLHSLTATVCPRFFSASARPAATASRVHPCPPDVEGGGDAGAGNVGMRSRIRVA